MHGRLPEPPPGPDPFADGLPTLDGIVRDGGTPRVRLRPTRPDDAEALFSIFSDETTLRYWSHEPFTDPEQARTYIDGIARALASRTLFQWAIAEQASDRLIGTVTLLAWDRTHRRAELGFILHRDWWGRGVASEAVRAVLAFAYGPMDLHRIEADVDPENAASLALLTRLGFRTEGRLAQRWFTYGEWRDSILLGRLAGEDWLPQPVTDV